MWLALPNKSAQFWCSPGFQQDNTFKRNNGEKSMNGILFSSQDELNIQRVCEEEKSVVKMGLVEGVRATMAGAE
jgi:hypothetical protein